MQHFLNFLPLPHGQGSFLPIFVIVLRRDLSQGEYKNIITTEKKMRQGPWVHAQKEA